MEPLSSVGYNVTGIRFTSRNGTSREETHGHVGYEPEAQARDHHSRNTVIARRECMISNKLISYPPLGRVDGEIDVFVLHISWIVRQLGTDRPSCCSLIEMIHLLGPSILLCGTMIDSRDRSSCGHTVSPRIRYSIKKIIKA